MLSREVFQVNGYISTYKEIDHWNNGQEYTAVQLIELGEDWIINNQDQLVFRKELNSENNGQPVDDLPF